MAKAKQVEMKMPRKKAAPAPRKKKTVAKVTEWLKTTAGVISSVTIIASALVGLATWAINGMLAGVNEKLDDVAGQMEDIKMDAVRTQLLTLMSNYPENKSEILKVADKYFNEMHGDWYMTELFEQWANAHEVDAKTLINKK